MAITHCNIEYMNVLHKLGDQWINGKSTKGGDDVGVMLIRFVQINFIGGFMDRKDN